MTPPEGFVYAPGLVTPEEERALIAQIVQLPLAPAVFHGFTARRRIVHFGETPDFLLALRLKAAALGGGPLESLTKALVTEYPPGAVIGWHRDAPMFGPVVVGVSLGAACRMRFRRGHARGAAAPAVERAAIVLEPRSGYVMAGAARAEWQHSIPAVDALRYSVTFRSVRTAG